MAYTKKTWVNRSSEYPTRRRLTAVSGQSNVYDVTREEGTVATDGDSFSATTMNDLENRIDSAFGNLGITVSTSGSGNSVSSVSTSGNSIVVEKNINAIQAMGGVDIDNKITTAYIKQDVWYTATQDCFVHTCDRKSSFTLGSTTSANTIECDISGGDQMKTLFFLKKGQKITCGASSNARIDVYGVKF